MAEYKSGLFVDIREAILRYFPAKKTSNSGVLHYSQVNVTTELRGTIKDAGLPSDQESFYLMFQKCGKDFGYRAQGHNHLQEAQRLPIVSEIQQSVLTATSHTNLIPQPPP